MYAIEFEAEIENGVIQIPEVFQDLQGKKHVKLFIMYEKSDHQKEESLDRSETKAFSNHSANLILEWKDESEDDVWK